MREKVIKEEHPLKDPVCGMSVSKESQYTFHHQDEAYYFCSEHCLHKFKEDPKQYINQVPLLSPQKTSPPQKRDKTSIIYTCPMHPEIQQQRAGSCPKCGMALEPMEGEVEEKNEELIAMSRRFWIGTLLVLPLFILAMIADIMPAWLPDSSRREDPCRWCGHRG